MRDPIPDPIPDPNLAIDPLPPGSTSDDSTDDDLERASWDDWRRTFGNRALAHLFGRPAPGSA